MAQNSNDAYREELMNKIKENYLSVALGFLVFLIAVTLIYRSTTNRQKTRMEEEQAQEQMMEQKKNVHVVKAGESISSIARDVLGSMDYADEIAAANSLKNPEVIEVGQELTIPEVGSRAEPTAAAEPTKAMEKKEEPAAMQGAQTSQAKITGNTYTVLRGDTLATIAKRAYGDESMYKKIMQANGLRNANRVEAGMVLKLPR